MTSVFQTVKKRYDFIAKKIYSLFEPQQSISPSPEISKRANVFNSILSPFETYVVSLQSLLIWERPFLSAGAFVTINILYWLIVLWNRRFFSILAVIALVLFLYRTWINQIWPEIRVPPQEGEDTESWISLSPGILSVPELSHYLNDICEKMLMLWKDVWKLRKENHGLFCALMCGFFSLLAVIGKVIPGVLIIYSLVLILSLGPGIALHLIPSTLYDHIIGYFAESDGQGSLNSSKSAGQSDKDSDLEEFVPEISAEVIRQLSLKEDVPEVPSPGVVLTDSLDPEAPIDEHYINESDDFSLYHGLGAFPSVEEEGESELEDDISDDIVPKLEPENNEMNFVTSHFKEDSSESESDVFTEGLSFSRTQEQETAAKKVTSPEKNKVGTSESSVPKPKISSSSDLEDDELMDFEILEESDVMS